jgi:hypothetical protein
MDLRRLRAGEWITALGGAALLVALFLPWYGAEIAAFVGEPGSPVQRPTLSGWESFAILDVILAVVGLAAVMLLVVTATQRSPALPIARDSLVCLGGLVALVLVLVRTANLPGDADGRELGLWLGLASALVLTVGAAIAMRDERLSSEGRQVDLTGRPTPAQPEVEVVPPPAK